MFGTGRAKRSVNVSISADLLRAARMDNLNLSTVMEAALREELRRRRREQWLTVNADGIEAYNRDVERNGVFGAWTKNF